MELLQIETDIGLIRKNNEDTALAISHPKNKRIKLLLVADGMGGKAHGEIASNYVTSAINKWFNNKEPKELNDIEKTESLLKRLIKKINDDLIKEFGLNNLGTTLTLALITYRKTIFLNVGDSRGYLFKNCNLIQVTEDDSDVWSYYKYGAVRKDDLRYFSNNNIINACIGLSNELCRITTTIVKNDYDMLFLFTDGVTDLITDKKIKKIINSNDKCEILKKIINEAVNVNQHLHVPIRLLRKRYVSYIIPFKGRDNATGAVYVKEV